MIYKNYTDNLAIGKKYWVLKVNDRLMKSVMESTENGKTYLNYGRLLYDAMSLCTLNGTYEKESELVTVPEGSKFKTIYNTVYCFQSVDNEFERHEIEYAELDKFVYEERDDYLVLLFKASIRWKNGSDTTRIKFDDFIKQKIRESQDRKPEKWIF